MHVLTYYLIQMCNFKQVASLESSMETMKSNVVGLGNYINSINSDLGSMLTSFDGYANKINNDIAYVKSNVSELNDDINDMNLKTEDLRIKMDTMDYSTTTLKGPEISKRNCGLLNFTKKSKKKRKILKFLACPQKILLIIWPLFRC